MKESEILKGLTPKQKEAVTFGGGPCLVVAGAGTGKTSVITRRISWLISKKMAKPDQILALTFTEKAASEMILRVDELSDYVYLGLSISTFHSFGSDLISEFSYELGLPPDVRVLSSAEQVLFIKDKIFEFNFVHYQNLGDPSAMIRDLIKIFSRAKDEAVTPEKWIKKAKNKMKKSKDKAEREESEKELELANAYKKYNDLLRENGYIDYGDQIFLILDLLKKPSVAKKIKERYLYVLIDEFQDTNYVQSEVIRRIFGDSGNVMVVGDDDQSIYKFRGASVSNILDFKKSYKGAKTIVLNKNFRSTQKILDISYKFINHNNPNRLEVKEKINKKLISDLGEGADSRLYLFSDETKEADFVAEKIEKELKKGKSLTDFAILVRANRHAEEFVLALKKRGIPYVFSGLAGLYQKIEIKNLISLISILSDPEDDLSLFHLSASEIYDFDMTDLAILSSYSRKNNKSLLSVYEKIDTLSKEVEIGNNTKEKAKKVFEDLKILREESKTSTAGEIVNLFLKNSGYYAKLTKEAKSGSLEAHNKINNIASFFDRVISFQRNYRDHSLEKFARYLELVIDIGSDSSESENVLGLEAVSVLSMHKAKGLEYDTVFIVSLSDSHMPGRNYSRGFEFPKYLINGEVEKSDTATIEEERRLFYVAMTRAKNNLYFSASLDYGTKKSHKVSRFLIETFGLERFQDKFLKPESIERIKGFEKITNLYNVALEPIPDSEKIVLSRAAIDDWLTCPFKYQLIHVTPIRIVANASVAYGNAIHNTIGEYYKLKMAGRQVKIDKIFEWFDIFWQESGFLSKTHERMRYETGRTALKRFFEKAQKEELPKYIEKEFKLKIENNIIVGRYDAIFEKDGQIEIVDFKTSQIKNQKKANERTKQSSQLAMYALSWYEASGVLPGLVKLYFIDTGIVGSFAPTEKTIKKTKEEIIKATRGVRVRNYEATPNMSSCGYCPFSLYCPVAVKDSIGD